MRVFICMFPVEHGAYIPFNHIFQKYIAEQVTALVDPSPWFVAKYGEDWRLMFRISSNWSPDDEDMDRAVQLSDSEKVKLARYRSFTLEPLRVELRGPTVYKKDQEVEYSIFLPFRLVIESEHPPATALEYIFAGVYTVLEKMQIDTSRLRTEQDRVVQHGCSDATMIDHNLASKIEVNPSLWFSLPPS
jgi:hypothetical protein